jgi:hypothetical protein
MLQNAATAWSRHESAWAAFFVIERRNKYRVHEFGPGRAPLFDPQSAVGPAQIPNARGCLLLGAGTRTASRSARPAAAIVVSAAADIRKSESDEKILSFQKMTAAVTTSPSKPRPKAETNVHPPKPPQSPLALRARGDALPNASA